MTALRGLGFLLALLGGQPLPTDTQEREESHDPLFKAVGGSIEMGYCFGVDYVVIYRLLPEGSLLLANSSDWKGLLSPPLGYEGRVKITDQLEGLLGLEIKALKTSDSGIYKRECWKDSVLVNQHEHYLHVCGEETTQEISLVADGGADLVCNISSTAESNSTLRWFREIYPNYRMALLLDTQRSLLPLDEDLHGILQVHAGGSALHVPQTVMKDSHSFYCLNMRGDQCLSVQNIHPPTHEEPEPKPVFRSVGEKVVLPCSSQRLQHQQIYWETPLGRVDSASPAQDGMFIVRDEQSADVSLVIPTLDESHSGDYRCVSTYLLEEYSMAICPKLDKTQVLFSPGNKVVMRCDHGRQDSSSVQWYRKGHEEDELIFDSSDPSAEIPADLTDRAEFSELDSSLVLTELTEKDSRPHWCVVLDNQDYFDDDEDTPQNNMENTDSTNSEYSNLWFTEEEYSEKCLYTQMTNLTLQSVHQDIKPKTVPNIRQVGTEARPPTEPEPKLESDPMLLAVVGGVVAAVIVVVIGVVVVLRRRVKNRKRRSHSGAVELRGKPGETDHLSPTQHQP